VSPEYLPRRYVRRLSLEEIFRRQEGKERRDIRNKTAHLSRGNTLKEIADYLGMHYTTVSKIIAKAVVSKK
jgi:DNA-binding MarR family transcriptional regulator